jgi:hypothetical protein
MLSGAMLSVEFFIVMLGVIIAECLCECGYAECCYDECHYVEFHYV